MSNKTSNENVANVEVIKNFILELKEFELNRDTLEVTNALEELLAEREQKDKRIQELEEALLKVKEKNTTLFITCRNSIPKQVVIDKMKEVKRLRDRCITAEAYNIAQGEIIVLQELLGGEK